MTRDEFLDGINYFSELIDFCQEYGCDYCDDALDEDARDEEIKYELEEYGSDYSWQDIRDYLYDIPTGYDYYRRNGIFDYEGLDDTDFESYKDDVYDWAVDNDCFDDDEEEEGEYEEYDEYAFSSDPEPEDEEPVEDEDFPIDDLMNMSVDMLVVIRCADEERKNEADMEFNDFISRNMPKVLA